MHHHEWPERDGVAFLLGAPSIASRTARHVRGDGFDWTSLLDEARSMSGGEAVLVRAAHDLWTAEQSVGLWELPRRLDDPGFDRVLRALRIYRGHVSVGRALESAARRLDTVAA